MEIGKVGLFGKAVVFAVRAHDGQVRKGSNVPYIVHPLEAAAICATVTADEEVLAAAVLHDVLEDAGVMESELEELFGARVASLVRDQSEDKRRGESASATWRTRKEEALEHLRSVHDVGVRTVYLGDKLSNMRATRANLEADGEAFWQRFNESDPRQQGWYYLTIAQILEPDLGSTLAWREYNDLVHGIFDGYGYA